MDLTDEQKSQLKFLLDTNVISQKEYDDKMYPKETWDVKKFANGMLSIFSPVEWAKDIYSLLNVRKIIIYLIIIISIFGYGYMKGVKGKPVHFDVEGKEAYIKLNGETLHIKSDGTAEIIDTKTGKKIKDINVKDVKDLDKFVTPVAFQFKPVGVVGTGFGGGKAGIEGGVGISWLRAWYTSVESFVTNRAVYPVGVSYKLDKIKMPNSAIGIGVGMRYDKSIRTIFYYRWSF